jgi:hypothetical protein
MRDIEKLSTMKKEEAEKYIAEQNWKALKEEE